MKVEMHPTLSNTKLSKNKKVLSPPSRDSRDRVLDNIALLSMDGFFINEICKDSTPKGKKQPLELKKFDKFTLFLLAASFVVVVVDIYKAVKEHFDEKKYNEQLKNSVNN